eukprot:TRINITY_DN2832_c1_g1_i1.p1 TRINITY_DN2832_c1_g1~~TRINITY_DN2832_c1_g1_i1.p1  ORF type:complete len:356 (+),score=90.72 TRINITY_DN2832_c1_g1_i1:35-1069(+)
MIEGNTENSRLDLNNSSALETSSNTVSSMGVPLYNIYQYPSNIIPLHSQMSPLNLYPANSVNMMCSLENVLKNNNNAMSKKRLNWTPELHAKFVAAVKELGIKSAVPRTILKHMGETGNLSRENIASHLQKYRLLARKQRGIKNEVSLDDTDLPLKDSLLDKFHVEQAALQIANEKTKDDKNVKNVEDDLEKDCPNKFSAKIEEKSKIDDKVYTKEPDRASGTVGVPVTMTGIPSGDAQMMIYSSPMMYPPSYSPSSTSHTQFPPLFMQSLSPYHSVSPMNASPLSQHGYLMMMYPNYPIQNQTPHTYYSNEVSPINDNNSENSQITNDANTPISTSFDNNFLY